VKPRAAFWSELELFTNTNRDVYKGDGRTLHEIGTELGLNELSMQQVQQDAGKPDKVAMNIWRKLCPTHSDRLFVESITNVPSSTINNIYGKFIDFINVNIVSNIHSIFYFSICSFMLSKH
jgi:hypothetical protein